MFGKSPDGGIQIKQIGGDNFRIAVDQLRNRVVLPIKKDLKANDRADVRQKRTLPI